MIHFDLDQAEHELLNEDLADLGEEIGRTDDPTCRKMLKERETRAQNLLARLQKAKEALAPKA